MSSFHEIKNGDVGIGRRIMENFRHVNYARPLFPTTSAGARVDDTIDFGEADAVWADIHFDGTFNMDGEAFTSKADLSTRASLADASATIEAPALTTLSWDSQDQIKGAMHSLSFNPSRVLFPSPGAYLISVRIRWSSGMTNGFFYAVLNGDADLSNALYKIGFDRPSQGGGGSQGVRMFFWYDFAKDDYLQIKIVGTGTAGTVTANLNVCRICPT